MVQRTDDGDGGSKRLKGNSNRSDSDGTESGTHTIRRKKRRERNRAETKHGGEEMRHFPLQPYNIRRK